MTSKNTHTLYKYTDITIYIIFISEGYCMFSVDQKQYITQYTRILLATKKIIPILIVTILSICISIYILNHPTQKNHYSPTQVQTAIIQNAIQKFQDPQTISQWEIITKLWPLQVTENGLQSQDNLIKIVWFIIPKNSTIYSINTLKPIEYFQNTGYDIDTLRLQIGALLNGSIPTINRNKHNNNTLPTSSLYASFDLDCIQQTIHSPLCRQNIENFLATFYTFDIQTAESELPSIRQNLKKTKYQQEFCDRLLSYSQYNQIFSSAIQTTLQSCDEESKAIYERAHNLHNINTELQNNTFTQTVYNDKELNAYKIMSLAQTIIYEIQQDIINTRRIEWYSNQIQALLRKPIVDAIYRDIQYWIINYQLLPYLQQNNTRNQTYNTISSLLLSLNRENVLLQHNGLQKMVTNQALITKQQEIMSRENNNTNSIIQWLSSLPYITIEFNNNTDDIISIHGQLNIVDAIAGESRTAFIATWQINLNRLIIQEIDLPEYKLFTTIINAFIQTRNTTLPWLYSYINENIALYRTQKNQEICEQIKNITTFKINVCNASLIQGEQTIQDTVTTYKIQIENNTIQQVQTSDPLLTTYLNKQYAQTVSDSIRIGSIIQEIITTQIPYNNEQEQIIIDTDSIQVIDAFSLFFKTKPTDIKHIQDTYYIEFTIDNINFVLSYNLQKNITGPLFFKDIIVNEKPLRVSKRAITLETKSSPIINKFIADPLSYIQDVDPFTYQTYLQLQ